MTRNPLPPKIRKPKVGEGVERLVAGVVAKVRELSGGGGGEDEEGGT